MRSIKALSLALLIIALGALPAMASTTYIVTGTSNNNDGQRFNHSFTTSADGVVTIRVVWKASKRGGYTLSLRRVVDCSDVNSATEGYVVQTVNTTQTPGDWTVTVPDATATAEGECWRVDFFPYSGGKVNVTLHVTTP